MTRVDYTIPGWEPQPSTPASEAQTQPVSFQAFLERAPQPMAARVENLLGLNAAPPSGFTLPPPPVPAGLSGAGLHELRARWDSLLANHAAEPESQGMMSMLRDLQAGDDAIRLRQAAETRC